MSKEAKPILVVEDDADLCNSILTALHRAGYEPVGVTELRNAMFKLKNQQYACILLDLRLGTDSGIELVDFVRDRPDTPNTKTPILVISGHLDRSVVEKIGPRIQGALVKPFDMNALMQTIKKQTE